MIFSPPLNAKPCSDTLYEEISVDAKGKGASESEGFHSKCGGLYNTYRAEALFFLILQ